MRTLASQKCHSENIRKYYHPMRSFKMSVKKKPGDLTDQYTDLRTPDMKKGVGVPVPKISLSVQRIFSYIEPYFPTSICLLFCSFRAYHPWLSSSPSIYIYTLTPSGDRPLHLKGRMSSYLLLLLRSST